MHIAEASETSGLSIDTIRFYEKSGMLPDLPRDDRGWRRFTPDTVGWLEVLANLRKTGMPLDDVRRFAASANGPDAMSVPAMKERLELLRTHAARLTLKQAELNRCTAYLNGKISNYAERLAEQ
ncbi:MAG: MerR family transcriptional regulator [Pseudomonadota bacterium]